MHIRDLSQDAIALAISEIILSFYRYSNRDDGYRTQQSRRYSADEEDDWDNRRRDDRDERGGGRGREEYGR